MYMGCSNHFVQVLLKPQEKIGLEHSTGEIGMKHKTKQRKKLQQRINMF